MKEAMMSIGTSLIFSSNFNQSEIYSIDGLYPDK
jgi:hypothetical protein